MRNYLKSQHKKLLVYNKTTYSLIVCLRICLFIYTLFSKYLCISFSKLILWNNHSDLWNHKCGFRIVPDIIITIFYIAIQCIKTVVDLNIISINEVCSVVCIIINQKKNVWWSRVCFVQNNIIQCNYLQSHDHYLSRNFSNSSNIKKYSKLFCRKFK